MVNKAKHEVVSKSVTLSNYSEASNTYFFMVVQLHENKK